MNQDQLTLLLIKGAITDLPPTDQAVVEACVKQLRDVLAAFTPEHGAFALSLLGAEAAAAS